MTATNPVIETLQKYIDQGEIAGAAVRVHKDGKTIVDACLGWADIESRMPVTDRTVFRLCSMSKPVTAVLGMTLVEKGELDLEAPVKSILPVFSHMPDLTVRMLFDHSSGILTGESGASFEPVPEDTLEEHIARMAKHPLEFPNGTGTGYSGLGGLDILGRVIEVVTGTAFEDYLAQALTVPLKMPDTRFGSNADQDARTATLYEYTPGWPLRDVTATDGLFAKVYGKNVRHASGSAAMIGTLNDYDRFTRMLLNEGELDGARILKPETVQMMHVPSAKNGLELFPGSIWGLGMLIFRDNALSGRKLYDGTFGWSGAYGTHFYVAPKQNLCMTLMVNRSNSDGAGSYVSMATEEAIWQMLNP